jgi:hypothetical protein
MSSKVAKIGLSVIFTSLIVISPFVLYSYYIRWEAERCLRTFSQFRPGSTTIEEATKALQPFKRFEVDGTAMDYGRDYPLRTYQFMNRGHHLLGLFHPTFFQVGLTFRQDGRVLEMSAGLLQEPFHSVSTIESLPLSEHLQTLRESASGMVVVVYDPPLRMRVEITPRASAELRKAAYSYNLSCFTALQGCQNVYKMLPTVKQYAAK